MKKQVSQKEAVFRLVMRLSKGKGLSEESKQKVYAQLERDFVAGKINLKPTKSNIVKLADERALRSYVIGLVHNWIRKDERLAKIAA